MQKRSKGKAIKVLSLLGAVVASAALALNGQYVEAGGVLTAAFSSASVFTIED